MGKTTAVDRLIFTLLFSVIIHLTILLGVSFDASSPPTNQPLVNLEITLVKQQTELAPEQADFLAQANNEGGGETDEKSPEPTPEKPKKKEIEEPAAPEPKPTALPVEPTPEMVEPTPEPVKPTPLKPKPQPEAQSEKKITQAKAERKITVVEEIAKEELTAEVAPKRKISSQELMFNAKNEIARLEDKLAKSTEQLSKRPKKLKISSRTKAYAAAAYMKGWEMKVERIGNFNYPQEAKRQGLNGSLMLSVDINPDGSVGPNGIVVSRSSGYKILDDAAIKIVQLGAPYAAIPDDVLKGHDMLTIIRTWKFETNRGLSTR